MDGKPHSKARFTGAGFKFDFAPMTVADDAIADDEAKAGAGADGFGREKRLEHARHSLVHKEESHRFVAKLQLLRRIEG